MSLDKFDTENMEEVHSVSPLPVKVEPTLLTFPQAMQAIIENSKLTRVSWNDKQEYGVLQDGFLVIHTKGEDHKWTINDGDLLAEDWFVIEEN